MLQQPTQPLAANDALQADRFAFGRRIFHRRRQIIGKAIVGRRKVSA
jgi:hypothetical protein